MPLTRREFVGTSARALVAAGAASQLGWLAACGDEPSLDSLAADLEGPLLRPGDRGYRPARLVFNPRFDGTQPLAVAECASARDVATAISWARDTETPLTAKCGGHSYEGYSTTSGLVIDVSRLDRVAVDRDAGTARIGAGSRLFDVYARLAKHGVSIPAGSCPTVGIAGLALGGGIGLSGRKHGLTLDRLRGIEIVTADGRVRHCSTDREPDLFWASRGGGGGNFGVATQFEFEVHPVAEVAVYSLEWDWKHAREVFDAWQRHAPHDPDELFSIIKLASIPASDDPKAQHVPKVISVGQYLGPESELEELLRPLTAAGAPSTRNVDTMKYLDAQVMWAGCAPHANCHLATGAAHGSVHREPFKAKSDYMNELLPGAAVETMIRWVERWPGSSNPSGAAIQLDTSGGAINRVAPDATAFVHRDDLYSAQYLAYWGARDSQRVVDAALGWITDFHAEMRPYVSGFAYQNYIDADLADWERAYYGQNLPRLTEAKQTYDPDDVFRFEQSIPLSA